MAIEAKIKFTQGATTDDPGVSVLGAISTQVDVTNGNNNGIIYWKWELTAKPTASALTLGILSEGNVNNTNFTPDVRGGYMVKLTVRDTRGNQSIDTRCFGILETSGRFIPPFGGNLRSMNFGNNDFGWFPYAEAWLKYVDTIMGGGGGGAPTDAQYVAMAANGTLTDERVLAAVAGELTLTDGGAGNNADLGLANAGPGAGTFLNPSSVDIDAKGRVTAITSGPAGIGWESILDIDFTSLSSATFGGAGPHSIGGTSWDTENHANTESDTEVINGTGLVIKPSQSTDWPVTGTVTAPVLHVRLRDLSSSWSVRKFMRVTCWMYASDVAPDFNAVFMALYAGNISTGEHHVVPKLGATTVGSPNRGIYCLERRPAVSGGGTLRQIEYAGNIATATEGNVAMLNFDRNFLTKYELFVGDSSGIADPAVSTVFPAVLSANSAAAVQNTSDTDFRISKYTDDVRLALGAQRAGSGDTTMQGIIRKIKIEMRD